MEANILVVEDEKGIRDAITIYLKNQGYHVYEAENGVQGLEMVENHTIHLAIVDIMMPVMDGITMTMKLREKIEVNPRNPRYLKVVWGIGYKIEK